MTADKADVCMRWPLSLICRADDRGPHEDVYDWRCSLHDRALTLAYRIHWTTRYRHD